MVTIFTDNFSFFMLNVNVEVMNGVKIDNDSNIIYGY